MPLNPRGGSLRQKDHQPGPDSRETLRAIVEGDPDPRALRDGGGKPLDLLLHRESPEARPQASVAPPKAPTPPDEPFPWEAKAKPPPPSVPPPLAPPTPPEV